MAALRVGNCFNATIVASTAMAGLMLWSSSGEGRAFRTAIAARGGTERRRRVLIVHLDDYRTEESGEWESTMFRSAGSVGLVGSVRLVGSVGPAGGWPGA